MGRFGLDFNFSNSSSTRLLSGVRVEYHSFRLDFGEWGQNNSTNMRKNESLHFLYNLNQNPKYYL